MGCNPIAPPPSCREGSEEGVAALSSGEKLILVMLSEIYKKLDIDDEIDAEIVKSSLFSGYEWAISWKYPEIFEVDNPTYVDETTKILDMYRWIESGLDKLSDIDLERLKSDVKPFDEYLNFRGFDANNDKHYGVLRHLIDVLDLYYEHKGKYLNTHSSATLPRYRKMLSVCEALRARGAMSRRLTKIWSKWLAARRRRFC